MEQPLRFHPRSGHVARLRGHPLSQRGRVGRVDGPPDRRARGEADGDGDGFFGPGVAVSRTLCFPVVALVAPGSAVAEMARGPSSPWYASISAGRLSFG